MERWWEALLGEAKELPKLLKGILHGFSSHIALLMISTCKKDHQRVTAAYAPIVIVKSEEGDILQRTQ